MQNTIEPKPPWGRGRGRGGLLSLEGQRDGYHFRLEKCCQFVNWNKYCSKHFVIIWKKLKVCCLHTNNYCPQF